MRSIFLTFERQTYILKWQNVSSNKNNNKLAINCYLSFHLTVCNFIAFTTLINNHLTNLGSKQLMPV